MEDCAAARSHLEKCLTVWSGSGERHFQAARCSWREGDPDSAEQHLRLASRAGWPRPAVNLEQYFIDAQRGLTPDLERILGEMLTEAHAKKDDELKAVIAEASLLGFVRAGNIEEAEFAARGLVSWRPEHWRPHWLLGRVRAYTSSDAAREAFDRSLALYPNQPAVHFWLAKYHAERGRPKEAREHFKASGRELDTDAESSFVAARIHFLSGETSEAIECLGRVLADQRFPQGPALALRSVLALEENKLDDASAWLMKAQALAPFHPEVLDAEIVMATRQGDKERLKQCQQRQKQQQERRDQLPGLYKKLNALRYQPRANTEERAELKYQLGATLFQLGEDETAVQWLESALRDNPEHAGAREALMEFHKRVRGQDASRGQNGSAAQGARPWDAEKSGISRASEGKKSERRLPLPDSASSQGSSGISSPPARVAKAGMISAAE